VVGGDALLAVEGMPAGNLADYNPMREHLQNLPAGAIITVTVLRAGRVLNRPELGLAAARRRGARRSARP